MSYDDVSVCDSYVSLMCWFFFFKHDTAYEMRISDWSSDVCSSDLLAPVLAVALVLFLLSLAGTGLQKLWDSGFSTAAVMMAVAAFAVLLANAVIGNGRDDRATTPALPWAEIGRSSSRESVCQYV